MVWSGLKWFWRVKTYLHECKFIRDALFPPQVQPQKAFPNSLLVVLCHMGVGGSSQSVDTGFHNISNIRMAFETRLLHWKPCFQKICKHFTFDKFFVYLHSPSVLPPFLFPFLPFTQPAINWRVSVATLVLLEVSFWKNGVLPASFPYSGARYWVSVKCLVIILIVADVN